MTERTIRSMAKEIAGVFYEDNRTPEFRLAFPTRKDYMRGLWHQPNGEIVIDKPGWVYHIDLARKILGTMLSKPDSVVSAVMKERIFDALVDENNRANIRNARVTQRIEPN
jgi:hypothetical protein